MVTAPDAGVSVRQQFTTTTLWWQGSLLLWAGQRTKAPGDLSRNRQITHIDKSPVVVARGARSAAIASRLLG